MSAPSPPLARLQSSTMSWIGKLLPPLQDTWPPTLPTVPTIAIGDPTRFPWGSVAGLGIPNWQEKVVGEWTFTETPNPAIDSFVPSDSGSGPGSDEKLQFVP